MYVPTPTVRNKALEIVRTYRNLTMLGTSIRIETLNQSAGVYTVKGDYADRRLFDVYESGTFEIKLNAKDLIPLEVIIHPNKKQ